MATYAIGDVHGCFETLRRLLRRVVYDPARDRLWFVGDLVNRGPDSLGVLRWAAAQGDRIVAVLGNHDLHLLARAEGISAARKRDTLEEILEAPDRDDLLSWLRSRPLLHREGEILLVHAGLFPEWTPAEAERLARDVEARLRGEKAPKLLTAVEQ
jgi:bis(5'-nucleosyl)-tetraphosphatase (symmetrical)